MIIKKIEKNFIFGPLQMLVSSLSFAIMVVTAKIATTHIPSAEATFFRFAAGLAVTYLIMHIRNIPIRTANQTLLLTRGLLSGVSVLLFFWAIAHGTISTVTVLQNTYPLFAAVIGIYLLHEKLTLKLISFMSITFLGILLLIRPDLTHLHVSDAVALASGVMGGFAVTTVRTLRQKQESTWTIFFYFCIFGAGIGLVLAIPTWVWPNPTEWFFLSLTALFGFIGQICMTNAYRYCKAAVGGILSMSTSVFSFLIGLLFLNEAVMWMDMAGIALVISGNVLVIAQEPHSIKRTHPDC